MLSKQESPRSGLLTKDGTPSGEVMSSTDVWLKTAMPFVLVDQMLSKALELGWLEKVTRNQASASLKTDRAKARRSRAPRKPLVQPTPDEVSEYAKSIGFHTLSAEQFCDYYSARGWKLSNNNAMKDWRAAVRTWKRNDEKKKASKAKKKEGEYDQSL